MFWLKYCLLCNSLDSSVKTLPRTTWSITLWLMKRINEKLQRVWDESLDQNLKLKLSGWIIGVKSGMDTLNYFYEVTILELVLRHSDNLSRTLQKPATTACLDKQFADLTLITLNTLRSDEIFELIWDRVLKDANIFRAVEYGSGGATPPPPRNFQRQELFFAKENCYIIWFHAVGKALTNHFE